MPKLGHQGPETYNSSTAPINPAVGDIWYNGFAMRVWTRGGWVLFAGPSTNASSQPMPLVSRRDDTLLRKGEYSYKGGVSGTVTIPAGASIISWSCFATAGGATVTIAGGDAIPVPVNGFVGGDKLEAFSTSVNFVFTGTAGYFIEYS